MFDALDRSATIAAYTCFVSFVSNFDFGQIFIDLCELLDYSFHSFDEIPCVLV